MTPDFVFNSNMSIEKQEDPKGINTFEVGDLVRTRIYKKIFQKKSDPSWSKDTYTVFRKDIQQIIKNLLLLDTRDPPTKL